MEVGSEGELVLESVGSVGKGTDLSGLVVENQEETGVDIVFVEVNAFEFVPKVALVTDKVPAKLFLVEVEIGEVLFIPALHRLKVLFCLHFLFLREGQDIGNVSFLIVQGPKKLPTGVLIFKLVSVSQDLDVGHWAHVHLLQLEVQSHSFQLISIYIYLSIYFTFLYFYSNQIILFIF